MNTMRLFRRVAAVALAAIVLPGTVARAEIPGRHPAFLHALSDLRAARWDLSHRPAGWVATANEEGAVAEVDRAIGEIHQAAIDDGKNTENHPAEDAHFDRAGRLHHALDLLRKARGDASGEEDNPTTHGLRLHALEHIDAAIQFTEHAIFDVEHHH